MSVIDESKKGKKARESGELNLVGLLEPIRLLLLGGSLNTSKEAIIKIFMLFDEPHWTLRPWGNFPPLPLPLGGLECSLFLQKKD